MAVINVNGGDLQTAVNNAQVGDTLDLGGFAYGGFRSSKRLNFVGAGASINGAPADGTNLVEHTPTAAGSSMRGDITIRGAEAWTWYSSLLSIRAADFVGDGLTLERGQFGIRRYQAPRSTLRNIRFRNLACAIEYNGSGGDVLEDFEITDLNRMMINDATNPNNDWGSSAIAPFRNDGLLVRRGKITNARSSHSYDYGRDGEAIAPFGGSRNCTFEDIEVRGCLILFEDGKAIGDPDNANYTLRRIKAYGSPEKLVDRWWDINAHFDKACKGMLVRSMNGMLIEDCDFIDLDAFTFFIETSSSYGGDVRNFRAINNRLRLKAGDNRAYLFDTETLFDQMTFGNDVQRAAGNVDVAWSKTPPRNTSDLASFKTWGMSVGDSEKWGPVVVEPPPPPPPTDPCAAITAERDALRTKIASAKTILAEENGLVQPARKTLRDIINRADAVLNG